MKCLMKIIPYGLLPGRLVYHFHTRTKTGRQKNYRMQHRMAYVQISEQDASKYGIAEGDMIEVTSRRGKVLEPAKIGGIEPGLVFIPFHYGYWDNDERPRAANELTLTEWDPVSKQPHFKYAAVKISKADEGILYKIGEAFETIKEKLKPQEE